MTTLPSPPISPVDAPYTLPKLMTTPTKRGHRKEHHRHPERRRDTFELLQALVIEHQRLEQQEYETLLREVPTISCRTPATPPKGILINSSYGNKTSNKCSAVSTETTKKAEMTFNSSPPSSRDNNHSCPTIPPSPSIPVTVPSPLPPPPSSISRIAFALPPTIAPLSSSSSIIHSASPSPLSPSHSSPPSSHAPRHSVVRFSDVPPKIYRYPKSPGQQDI